MTTFGELKEGDVFTVRLTKGARHGDGSLRSRMEGAEGAWFILADVPVTKIEPEAKPEPQPDEGIMTDCAYCGIGCKALTVSCMHGVTEGFCMRSKFTATLSKTVVQVGENATITRFWRTHECRKEFDKPSTVDVTPTTDAHREFLQAYVLARARAVPGSFNIERAIEKGQTAWIRIEELCKREAIR
jgi:hypothetical protein